MAATSPSVAAAARYGQSCEMNRLMINRGYNSERMGESPEITYSIPRWCTTDNIPSSSMQPVYRFYHYVEE